MAWAEVCAQLDSLLELAALEAPDNPSHPEKTLQRGGAFISTIIQLKTGAEPSEPSGREGEQLRR